MLINAQLVCIGSPQPDFQSANQLVCQPGTEVFVWPPCNRAHSQQFHFDILLHRDNPIARISLASAKSYKHSSWVLLISFSLIYFFFWLFSRCQRNCCFCRFSLGLKLCCHFKRSFIICLWNIFIII